LPQPHDLVPGHHERLIRLCQGGLVPDLADPESVTSRTEDVTAPFPELSGRAALRAARDERASDGPAGCPPPDH